MNKINFVVFLIVGLQVAGIEMWDNQYDGRLTFNCPTRESINTIKSKHDNGREDRIWDFTCKPSFESNPECFWTNYVNCFDEQFTFSCPGHFIISGVESYHDNGREDRRWRFKCCRVYNYCNYNCYWTPYVNNFDEEFTSYAPPLTYLAGAESHHANRQEDRRWKFQYCFRRSCRM